MEESRISAGTVIAERYRLEQEIGRGGMGTVWRALHLTLQGPVAIKLINSSLLDSAEAKARFLREARSAAALRSTHVVQILDHGLHEDVPFIVMELLLGESLADRLERRRVLSLAETLHVLRPVCHALSLAHQRRIVHRDLKPDNIFIAKEGELEVVKVLDFGIAKDRSSELRASLQTQEGAILGTPYYLSPEQAQGSPDIDHRADLWSLAVIACECLTGRRPFESKHMGDLIVRICSRSLPVPSELGAVPLGFDRWFEKALSRDPDQRYQSSTRLIETLSCLTKELNDTASTERVHSAPQPLRVDETDQPETDTPVELATSLGLSVQTWVTPLRKKLNLRRSILLAFGASAVGLGVYRLFRQEVADSSSPATEDDFTSQDAVPPPPEQTSPKPAQDSSDASQAPRTESTQAPASTSLVPSSPTVQPFPSPPSISGKRVHKRKPAAEVSARPVPPISVTAPTGSEPPVGDKQRVDFGF